MVKRISISVVVGVVTGVFCWFLLKHLHQGAGDFRWAIHLAERVVAHQNPYDTPARAISLAGGFRRLTLLACYAGSRGRFVLWG